MSKVFVDEVIQQEPMKRGVHDYEFSLRTRIDRLDRLFHPTYTRQRNYCQRLRAESSNFAVFRSVQFAFGHACIVGPSSVFRIACAWEHFQWYCYSWPWFWEAVWNFRWTWKTKMISTKSAQIVLKHKRTHNYFAFPFMSLIQKRSGDGRSAWLHESWTVTRNLSQSEDELKLKEVSMIKMNDIIFVFILF